MGKQSLLKYFTLLLMAYYVSLNVIPLVLKIDTIKYFSTSESECNDSEDNKEENKNCFEINELIIKTEDFSLFDNQIEIAQFYTQYYFKLAENVKDVLVPPPEKIII
jgi:hypothetical protein